MIDIQIRSGLVQNQNRCFLGQGPCKNDPLSFATTQLCNVAVFKCQGFSLFHNILNNPCICVRRRGKPWHMRITSHHDHFSGCKGEIDIKILGDQRDFPGQCLSCVTGQGLTLISYSSFNRLSVVDDEIDQGGLTAAVGTQNTIGHARFQHYGKIVNDLFPVVEKRNPFYFKNPFHYHTFAV